MIGGRGILSRVCFQNYSHFHKTPRPRARFSGKFGDPFPFNAVNPVPPDMPSFRQAARDVARFEIPGEAARRRAKIASPRARTGSSFEYGINPPVYVSARVPNWSALRELDWSRRGGSRHVPNIISQRAAVDASKSKQLPSKLPVFPFSSPAALPSSARENGSSPGVLSESYDEAAVHSTSPGLPVIPDGTPL